MTKKQILKELGLDDSYFFCEYIETDRLVYVIVDDEEREEFCNFTIGEHAKWKNNGEWFTPNYVKDEDVYDEIIGKKSMLDSLK